MFSKTNTGLISTIIPSDAVSLNCRRYISSGVVIATLALASCTSSGQRDISASSSHAIAPVQQEQAIATTTPQNAAVQNSPVEVTNSEALPQTIAQNAANPAPTNSNLSSNNNAYASLAPPVGAPPANNDALPGVTTQNPTGVIYQENPPATRSLAGPQELASQNPVYQQPTQVAALDTNGENPLSPNDLSAVYVPPTPEEEAQQRVNILDARMSHATCKGGWATPPDRLDAKRYTPGHPYYVEMRLRQTPLLPVGHTYIAYGRLSPEGIPIDEHVVMLSPLGGYGGAAVAAALPMPGVLKPVDDDCRIKPHAAYRVSVDAIKYEKLLQRIVKAQKKIPAYALFAYNCNHFASDIVAPIGILPPRNKYLVALKYIYGVIEANEGYNPRKRRRS